GINHNGDFNLARKLIDAAYVTGWDAAKLQRRNPHKSIPEHQKNIMRKTPWGEMTYLDYKLKIEFDDEQHIALNRYCNEKPLDYGLSFWDMTNLDLIFTLDLPWIKIPSAHLTNDDLIKAVCDYHKPIILSTGMSTVAEIDHAVELLNTECGNWTDCWDPYDPFILMHSNSTYPASQAELNLNCIPAMIERYNCLVGYSGHEVDLEPSVIAVALGACAIERHITLSHELWGTDQKASLEIHAADMLAKRIRGVKTMLGDGKKVVYESEIEVRRKLRG
ncbi:MAG TPA: N-acetylneuraminate synthase family protein, partial [Candidatus Nitrosocosmicus sp.]|nr:N-acetylneuraminate synthase family protein [Candidatus Nitrosocosmicus sp.]